LENFVRSTSFLGGIYLCLLIFLYEIIKNIFGQSLLSQVNISSLIILVGITYDIHRKIKTLGSNSGFFSHLKPKNLIS
jgi:preprotein translocase subunit SecY